MRNQFASSIPQLCNNSLPPHYVLEVDFPLSVHFLWFMLSLTTLS